MAFQETSLASACLSRLVIDRVEPRVKISLSIRASTSSPASVFRSTADCIRAVPCVGITAGAACLWPNLMCVPVLCVLCVRVTLRLLGSWPENLASSRLEPKAVQLLLFAVRAVLLAMTYAENSDPDRSAYLE